MKQSSHLQVEAAIQDLQNGKMVILVDDPERENEGDVIFPAETITPEITNFMIRHGSGIVCLSLTSAHLKQLNLPLMVPSQENTSLRGTPFTVSIEALGGISTGVSAADRTRTIQMAVRDNVKPEDLVRPGHIFPLQAKDGGVLERAGHTEGALDLVRLAGFKPAAVICEVMNPDGSMANGQRLKDFALAHELKIISIEDIIDYRLARENLIAESVTTNLLLAEHGEFKFTVIKEMFTKKEHIVLHKENSNPNQAPLVRVHSACMTGDLFGSQRCDCQRQFEYSLQRISAEGGVFIYLDQEGRGVGLFNKIKSYVLQEQGADTVEANERLGCPVDSRKYSLAANVLRNMDITDIRLLTNNPHKVSDLKKYGLTNIQRIAMPIFANAHNKKYLQTKQEKLNHYTNDPTACGEVL